MPAAAAGLPPATGAAPAAATARAPTPDGQQPDREGSGRHRFHIRADGSGRGGRQYFETGAAQEHQQQLEEQRWRQAQQEAALEQHSLAGGPHPATAAAAGGLMAGQAALREAGGAAPLPPLPPPPSSPQPAGSDARQHAMWVIEDGSGGSRSGSMAAEASDRLPPAGGSSGGDVNGSMKKGSDAFGDAVVLIEEPTEAEMWDWGAYFGSLPKKIKGGLDTRLPRPPLRDLFWSWLGAFLGILAVCAMNQWASPEIDIAFLVGSFGASAVLVFAVLESKMSQPRNFLGGQMLSALVGITTRVVIHQPWIAGPVGMSLALLLMQVTSTTHPPGGATALIAATLPTLPKWHGYAYLVTVGVGSCVMLCIALVINNLDPRRRWPTYWW